MFNRLNPKSFFQDVRLYNRLLSYVLVYKWYFFLGLAFVALFSLTIPAIAMLMKPLLDGSFVERDPVYIFWTPLILILLFAIRGVAGYLNGVCMNWVMGYVVYDIQTEMIQRSLHLPKSFFDKHPAAQVMARITADVNELTDAASHVLITVIRESLTIIGLLIWIFILDWVLSLTLIVAAPLIATLVRFVARRLRILHRKSMQLGAKFLQHLQEVTTYNQLVKLSQTEDYESQRLSDYANQIRRLKLKQAIANEITIPVAELITTIAIAGVVYLSLIRDWSDPITVGGFVSYMAALALISSAIKRLLRINETLQIGLVASERVFYLIDQQPERERGDKTFNSQLFRGEVEFKNVTFNYAGSEISSLDNLSLKINSQQTIALVGSSGSGKSTLASLIPRLYEIESGRLLIDGVDVCEYRISEIRKLIAFVSQDIFLLDDTIEANIAYGNLNGATLEQIKLAAKFANALDFIEELPDGFNTIVGERGIRLSGGQKQRIAIARALIKDAPILILDEATSNLDTSSEYHVRQALQALGKGRTVIIVAHRLSSIEHVRRIVVLHHGQVVEDGSHKKLMALRGHYHKLYTIFQESEKTSS